MTVASELIDVRTVAPPQRHPLIFSTFDGLAVGESFGLLNDHDPLALRSQFESIRAGQFDWRYLEAGPERWHVRIARVGAAGRAVGGCEDDAGGCRCSGG